MTDTIQSEAAEELYRVMNNPGPLSEGVDPVIGESLEETPEALRAAARPFVAKKRDHRRPTATEEAFVTAITEA